MGKLENETKFKIYPLILRDKLNNSFSIKCNYRSNNNSSFYYINNQCWDQNKFNPMSFLSQASSVKMTQAIRRANRPQKLAKAQNKRKFSYLNE